MIMTDCEAIQFTRAPYIPNSVTRKIERIKAAMLLHLHELYPDARMVWTGNAQSNAAMRGINIRMGFKTYKIETEYQMSRDQLAARLKTLKSASPAGRSEPKG